MTNLTTRKSRLKKHRLKDYGIDYDHVIIDEASVWFKNFTKGEFDSNHPPTNEGWTAIIKSGVNPRSLSFEDLKKSGWWEESTIADPKVVREIVKSRKLK